MSLFYSLATELIKKIIQYTLYLTFVAEDPFIAWFTAMWAFACYSITWWVTMTTGVVAIPTVCSVITFFN